MQKQQLSRRQFLGTSTAIAATGALALASQGKNVTFAEETTSGNVAYQSKLYKALICGEPTDEICAEWKKNGFDGMETSDWNVTPKKAEEKRVMAESHGIKIHSVMRGWAEFNNKNDAVARKTIDETKTALRAAAGYGASTILLVPCRVGGMDMPKPWEFKIDFDPATCLVRKVVDGDNAPYAEYIEAQNRSTEMSIKAIEELIPVAAETGVIIGVENVWNNLWVKPELAAAFVRYFNNPWVKTYLDLGNHVKYAPVEEWLEAGGGSLVKLHVKDFKINKGSANGGDFVAIGEGSINWPSVRNAIELVNYNGWMSIESDALSIEEHSKRLDSIIAGKPLVS